MNRRSPLDLIGRHDRTGPLPASLRDGAQPVPNRTSSWLRRVVLRKRPRFGFAPRRRAKASARCRDDVRRLLVSIVVMALQPMSISRPALASASLSESLQPGGPSYRAETATERLRGGGVGGVSLSTRSAPFSFISTRSSLDLLGRTMW